MSSTTPRVHFVVPAATPVLCDRLLREGVDAHWQIFDHGPMNWCLQTYVLLSGHYPRLTCSARFEHGAINIAHVSSITPFAVPYGTFVIGVRADYPPHPMAQLHVVQNKTQVDEDSCWLPHWAQPGLVSRSVDRRDVRTVGYAGMPYYLAGGAAEWQKRCQDLDLEFQVLGRSCWNDFSRIDILLAIRSFDGYRYDKKPPTKLFNAWYANVPMVGGSDSAFEQVGTAGVDYIAVNTLETACDAISRLARMPDEYEEMVQRGRERANEYSRSAIIQAWMAFMECAISRFESWQSDGRPSKVSWAATSVQQFTRATLRRARTLLLGPAPIKR